MSGEPAVVVEGVSKRFRLYHQRSSTLKQALLLRRRARYEEFFGLRDVSLEVAEGTTTGIIGENGSGKSTLLKCIAGILVPETGRVAVRGRLAALLELGTGFHQDYSGRENIYLNGALLGLPRSYITEVFDDIVDFAGPEVARFIDNAVKTYSSGMHARLGFAIAVHVDPDILVVDEVLAVGDENFQRKCYERIAEMKAEGRTMLVVSHDLEAVARLCDDCIWMDHGQVRGRGKTQSVIAQYLTEVNNREAEALQREAERAEQGLGAGAREGVGVTRVIFSGPDGPSHLLNTGEPFTATIKYTSPHPLIGVRFTLNLIRQDDILVFSTATDDLETLGLAFPAGGEVHLEMPSLALMEGTYRASIGITDIRSETPYQEIDRSFPFRVRTPPRKERGVALMEHRWVLPAEEAEGASRSASSGQAANA